MRHALIVDDDDSLRHSLADVLEEEGWAVELARDRSEALAALQRRVPELVLLDLQLPGADGTAVAADLRSLSRRPAVVVLSADSKAAALLAPGSADAFLSKPFDLGELLAVIGRLSGGRG